MLRRSPEFPELWEVAALECGLVEGQVYHYWFKVQSSSPYEDGRVVYCPDPVAYAVNRQVLSPGEEPYEPASVILYRGGLLVPCDSQGQVVSGVEDGVRIDHLPDHHLLNHHLPANSQLVIYRDLLLI